jgi:hypothetical protein
MAAMALPKPPDGTCAAGVGPSVAGVSIPGRLMRPWSDASAPAVWKLLPGRCQSMLGAVMPLLGSGGGEPIASGTDSSMADSGDPAMTEALSNSRACWPAIGLS